MAYNLNEINFRARTDPTEFIARCEEDYRAKISRAADLIVANLSRSPIVLLSGPSGSGKTTTAQKLEQELERRGIGTHAIAMDNYFKTVDPNTVPRTPDGAPDLESPECLDMELLNEHFTQLAAGKRIYVPKYEFARQMRVFLPSASVRLRRDEVAIFEGIHALNDSITSRHPEAFKLYLSARSNIHNGHGATCFKGTWIRLMRRAVRDYLFRGSDAAYTLSVWANVRRGEKLYISPFKDKADFQLDSALPYEVCIFKDVAGKLFSAVEEGTERFAELRSVVPALELFEHIDAQLVPADSLIREFIGGGIYEQ